MKVICSYIRSGSDGEGYVCHRQQAEVLPHGQLESPGADPYAGWRGGTARLLPIPMRLDSTSMRTKQATRRRCCARSLAMAHFVRVTSCRRFSELVRTAFTSCSHEPNEPPHVHVDRDTQSAKFWLGPVGLAGNLGFRPKELGRIERIVTRHENECLEAWREYFGE